MGVWEKVGSWCGDRRRGSSGAHHRAMGGEGAAGKHLWALVVGSQAGDQASLPQGAVCNPMANRRAGCLYSLPSVSHGNMEITPVGA